MESDARAWAEQQFGGAELGHKARNARAAQIAADLLRQPRASLPKACGETSAKRAYEFFANDHVRHAGLLSGPVKQTLARCAGETVILLVQDTTAPGFGGRERRKGLGPINDSEGAQGMLVHTCLALAEEGRVLGVLEQEVWARSDKKHAKDESVADRRKRTRESERWARTARTAHDRLVGAGVSAKRIHVGDRESDIFELFVEVDALQDGFVFRATYDRRTQQGDASARTYSLSEAEAAPVIATKTVVVPARPGQSARSAHLEIRAKRVEVLPPKVDGRSGPPIWMNVVVVSEIEPPSPKMALRWNLLTREPIATVNDVLRITEIYARRWTIEDFHMGLKTGCALEDRQFESFDRLANFLVFATAISVHVLQLRDASRAPEPRPASDVLSEIQLKLLRHSAPRLKDNCTAQEALRAVAALGGFYDTSKKAQPGWRTLFGGMQILIEREAGYLRALEDVRRAGGDLSQKAQ
jgi:hypothetical protein